jgi:hypothetical protein
VAYAAACAFALVSAAANLRFGLTLGSSSFEQAAYGAASLGSDGFKMALPLITVRLFPCGFVQIVIWLAAIACGAKGCSDTAKPDGQPDVVFNTHCYQDPKYLEWL